jgi:hypothetical protein
VLAAQSKKDQEIVELNGESEYQRELLRLHNLVEKLILNTDKFISDFINDPST